MRSIMLVLLLFFPGLHAAGWELVKEKDGISVSTRNEEGSSFLAFRSETVVEGDVAELIAVMYDTGGAPAWLHNCRFGMTLDERSFGENYIFEIYDLPFPARDRQVILHSTLSFTQEGARLEMQEANGFCDVRQDSRCAKVKGSDETWIKRLRGYYLFIPAGENRTRVIWEQHVEPGGTVPAWLANAMVVDIPYHSLLRLRELVKEEKYRFMTIPALQRLWQKEYEAFH